MFRAHRGKTVHSFLAHKGQPVQVFKAHALTALKAGKPKKISPAKLKAAKVAAYKPDLPVEPAEYKASKTRRPYKAAKPPIA